MTTVNSEKLSSARFAQATDAFVEVFTASVDFDQRMAQAGYSGLNRPCYHANALRHPD